MASEEYKESDLSKIVKRLMDEEGFEFGEAVKEAMEQTKNFESKADGGSVGIEILFGPKREDFNIGGRAKRNTPIDSRASAVEYAEALQKVSGGTQAQKRQDLSNYLGNLISAGGQKIGNAVTIPLQAAKGVLGIQGTPITDSMQASLQNIIQKQIKDSGKLSGNINYKDYGVKTNTQGNEFLGFGDRSFTDPEAALATTLGQASYSVDPKTGKITFTGGTAYDFGDDQFGGLGKFISKGGAFNQLPSASNKFQPGATEYNPDITLGSDFMKQFNQPKYPDYKTAALQSQYYKNNPSSLDSDLFRAAYARATDGPKTQITNEGQVYTDYGNYDPSRTYAAYMSNTGTSSSNPFFDQFKGSQYADMPAIMKAMYGDPGNLNPYYADGGRVGFKGGGHKSIDPNDLPPPYKKGFENVMDGPDAGIAARAYLAEQQQQKQLQQAKAIAPTPKPNLENINYIRQSMNQYGFSEPEILKAITQAGYADGGRVGLFMGGDPLTGQALSIYNSMNAYGFDDQAIANALTEQGLYTPPGSTPDTPDTTPGQTIGYQGGNDSPYAGQVVDQTDYGFNKKNYAPGEKLEINPAAFGVSFPDQPSSPKREGIINQAIDSFTSLPTRSLSSFASPTTGGNIVGPAEQGFMGQTLDIDPAGRTREEIRSLYDDYNRFTGRTSNFADARVKGKAGQVLGSLVGAASGIPFVGSGIEMFTNAFGPRGDKSLQSKYTVDGAGFGNTGARDEFGLATFDKKDGFLGLTGNTTRNYTDRMSERLGELTDFFGERIDDFDINNIDAATFNKMSKINGFYAKQVQAYKDRIEVERINREQKERERMEASAANRAEANAITNRLKDEFNRDSGGGFAVSGPDTSANPTGASNRASQERGFALHGAKGGSVPTGLATMFTRRR